MRSNGRAERRAHRRMSLALDVERVRSSAVLEHTCRYSPKLLEPLATDLSGGSPSSVTQDRRALAEAEGQDADDNPAAQPDLP
jgi:hypothetical protein